MSARVRRRRTLAALIVAALTIATVVVASRSSSTGSRTKKVLVGHGSAAKAVLRIDASESPWLLDSPRARAVALADGRGLVIAGGIDAQQATSGDVLSFRNDRGVSTVGALSVPTHDAAAAIVGGRRLVFGGGAQQVSDTVQALAPTGPAAVIGHLPRPRADFSAVAIGSTAYLVGGYDGTNPATDVLATTDGITYRTVARLPAAVRYPAVAALGDKIYVFGGEWAGHPTDAVQLIDTQAGHASTVGRLPAPRTQAAALVLGGTIYVAGGRVGGVPASDLLRFDPGTERVTSAGSLPSPVADAAAAVAGGTGYLVGGESSAAVSSIMVLRPTATTNTSHLASSRQRPFAGHLLIADRGNNRLIVVDAAKHVSWTYPSSTMPAPAGGFYFPDDGFFVDHGRSILSNEEENHTIVRIAFPSGALLWSYGHPKITGSGSGYLNQPDDAFLLRDGTVTVADAKNCRVLFISKQGKPISQIGTTGNCVHDPGHSLGYPNGDTPLADGNFLISEINGSWVSEYTRAGNLVWTVHLPITYPSDPQQIGPDLYLVADYTSPGGIVEFTREGRIVWTYRPTSGPGMLDHPSLAELFANGLIGVNDDYRHRVALIEPSTGQIVWQYGVTDQPGTGFNRVNTPDGFDLLLPDNTTPGHPSTG